jgi:hypothetical protein
VQKQLQRLDLTLSAVGIFNSKVNGTVVNNLAALNAGEAMGQYGSNTVGFQASLQYVVKPYIGLEFNYGESRYTEHFTGLGVAHFQNLFSTGFLVQADASEFTIGWLVHPPHPIFGLQPFLSAGAGTQAFRPTAFGGQEEPEQARMVYYYSLGVTKEVSKHFGFRGGFRELFFLDPDFGQNYLTILQHATTYEPTVGVYFHY